MEKADERRAEQRLRYRWPVRFASDQRKKPLAGQMFDLSSMGMAMLFYANEDCPRTDQSITAKFGVPCFDAHGSFDTAFFNRAGRVCRVDYLTTSVNKVAVRFAEPLFFKPGEQDISESDAQQRLRAKARSIVEAKEKGSTSVEAQAQIPKKLRAKIEAEVKAREQARAEAKSQARLREEAISRAMTEAEKRAAAEARALESARRFEQEIAKVRANAAREIARLEDETEYKIAEAKAEIRAKLLAQAKAREKDKKRQKKKDGKTTKSGLAKKFDEFITDRGQVY